MGPPRDRESLQRAQEGEQPVDELVLGLAVGPVPGPVDDEFYHSAETPQAVSYAKQATPFGRLGRPEDVAPVVGFLAGPGAGWISGQTIRVNGAMF